MSENISCDICGDDVPTDKIFIVESTQATVCELCYLRDLLADQRLAAMFGDGQEKEMVWDGITIRGLMTMKFEELIEELETYGYCGYCGSFDHTKEDCPNSK